MTAVAEGYIRAAFTGLRGQMFEYLGHQNGPMLTGRSLAGGDDLRDGLRVALGVELLVFLFEAPRVCAAVAHPAAERLLGIRGVHR